MAQPSFAQRLIGWQAQHGRQDMPWQHTRDPYRVWLSEIMLQQTQVGTVRAYYLRFLQQFPSMDALARAPLDEVLALWSGLGYYSRARNLHRCAQQLCAHGDAQWPHTAQQLEQLPGIGPSTAAAIAAFCFAQRISIMDANVERLLARHTGFAQDLSRSAARRALYAHAQDALPTAHLPRTMPAYTQALMDMGATICTARAPRCAACPVRADCVAQAQGRPEQYPVKTRTLRRRAESWWLLALHAPGHGIWLQRRSARGIWAALHSLPMFESEAALLAAVAPLEADAPQHHSAMRHQLTHRDWQLHPVQVQVQSPQSVAAAGLSGAWHAHPARLGLPAPVRAWLAQQGWLEDARAQ